ncbi:trihelix transcription factor GT-2-like [Carica papaya]|uniref:trihelix transcription factor GT-2-like n=1 Tax=Carica papaya TaxID=3649 RepID=UPI000B8CE3AF|nr:trihelix transcription factor GT-2-like [Carica papaya]
MVGDQSSLLPNSGDAAGTHEASSEVGGQEDNTNQGGDRGFGGNRWPRQETLALLKIRSDMDATFRDSSLKGPLWEEVSRSVCSINFIFFFFLFFFCDFHGSGNSSLVAQVSLNPYPVSTFVNVSSNLFSSSTSSSTASDEEFEERSSNRRKRKWKEFFKRLTKEVIHKQEDLQKKFLDALEKREHERMAREEAWRIQEMARINREHEILVKERSTAAAKDAAVISFLQKISSQQIPVQVPGNPNPNPNPSALPPPQPPPPIQEHLRHQQQQHYHLQQVPLAPVTNMEIVPRLDNGDNNISVINVAVPSPSRWPKAEVQALIKLRTSLDTKYQENGPKGPLWEEISAGMKRLGYNRSSKRCKEKWENINKYFKKVKESNKKRPEDSKTCPYFHQLDALYREKNGNNINKNETAPAGNITSVNYNNNNGNNIPAAAPLMVHPEQQWPLQMQHQQVQPQSMEDLERESAEHEEEDEEVGSEEEGDDDEEGGGFELVANKSSSVTSMAAGE